MVVSLFYAHPASNDIAFIKAEDILYVSELSYKEQHICCVERRLQMSDWIDRWIECCASKWDRASIGSGGCHEYLVCGVFMLLLREKDKLVATTRRDNKI